MRKIILVVVLLALCADVWALMWVRGNRDLIEPSLVKVVTETPDTANKVKAKLESTMSLQPTVSTDVTKERYVPGGFKVYYAPPGGNVDLMKAVESTLKHDKVVFHESPDKKEVIYNKPYPTEKEARAALNKVKNYGFTTAENLVIKTQKVCVVEIKVEGRNAIDQIRENLKEFKEIRSEDVTAAPLPPGAP